MPGGNKQTCKYYRKDFIEPSMNFPSHQTLKGEMSQDICPWLFQAVILKSLSFFFSALSVKYKPSKITKLQSKSQNCHRFNINVTTFRR